MLTDVAHPSLNDRDFLVIFSKTGFPLTGGSWRRSPIKSMFLEPNHSLVPKSSSNLKCTYSKLRLDTIETSSIYNDEFYVTKGGSHNLLRSFWS